MAYTPSHRLFFEMVLTLWINVQLTVNKWITANSALSNYLMCYRDVCTSCCMMRTSVIYIVRITKQSIIRKWWCCSSLAINRNILVSCSLSLTLNLWCSIGYYARHVIVLITVYKQPIENILYKNINKNNKYKLTIFDKLINSNVCPLVVFIDIEQVFLLYIHDYLTLQNH